MANAYADLATLKSASVLNAPDDAHDERLLTLLEAASRWIDGYCGRQFCASHGERRFDGTGKAALTVPDLVSASEVRVREASGEWIGWSSGDWILYPLNSAPREPGGRPYTRIMLAGKHRRFPLSRAGVTVGGVWGYCDVREDTGVQTGGDAPVASGDAALTLEADEGAIDLSAGHTIRIGDEQLYVTAASTDDQDVTTLTVQRGVNGTTAAAHAVGSRVSVYRYPRGVAEACLLQAAGGRWERRQRRLLHGPHAAGPVSPPSRRPGGVSMTGYASAGRSYVAVADAYGTMRDLSPWVERVSPLGQALTGRDVTGVNDAAARTAAGPAAAQEFTLSGRWDDTPEIGPDAVLSGVVGHSVAVEYGPVGSAAGQRRVSGTFVCLSYRISSRAGEPVRFEAAFRQDGLVELGVW